MSFQLQKQIESRQQNNKKNKNQNIFSSNTLESINKENNEKKMYKDLSLNFLKNYSSTSLTNKTYANHSHKKIIVIDKSRLNKNKKFSFNLIYQNKHIKFPLKLNYNNKQSISLKNLIDEDNLHIHPLRSSEKRKNSKTKIELFGANSTSSFLNIKENNKELSKPIKIKCNNIIKNKEISSSFIDKKLKVKSASKIKIKHIKNNLSLNKKNKIFSKQNEKFKENLFNNSNKSIEFCLSNMKPINKRRNLSIGLNENNNSNTNSIKELYNKKTGHYNLDSSNLLYDNISFSLKKNQIKEFGYLQGIVPGYNTSNKIKFNTTYKLNTINNYSKKSSINLSSLPNLLCNNYMNMQSQTVIKNNIININEQNKKILKDNKNKNISEKKNLINNYIKFNYVNNHQNKDNYNNYNRIKGGNNETNYNINEKLKNIHFGIKSLLDNLYKIYYINKDIKDNYLI